jgi:hypothetical protein
MPLDTRIALGAQPLQIESPLAQYGQAVGIQNAMQQNQLGQMQMSAAQRAMQEEEGAKNFLSGNPDLNTVENQRRLLAFGKTGLGYAKAIAEQKKAGLEGDKLAAEILGANQKNFTALNSPMDAAARGPAGITDYVEALYKDPVLGPLAARVKSREQALAENQLLFQKDPQQWVMAHANLDGQHLLDALKTSQENAAEKARIASLPPLPGAVPTGTVNATGAGLVVPGTPAAAATPALKQIGDFRIDPSISAENTFKLQQMSNQGPVKLPPNEYYGQDASGKLVIKTIPMDNQLAVAAAPAAAGNVNALAAPTGNEATLQAMAAERKKLTDRLNVLDRMPYSKGKEDETKRIEAQLKDLTAPINLRESGTAITPFGSVTAAAAPTELAKLQKEKLAAVAAGDKTAAAQIDSKIAVMTQLQDHRTEIEKLLAAKAAADKAGDKNASDAIDQQIKVKNQLQDHRTETEKLLAVAADPQANQTAKDAAKARIAHLSYIPAKDVPARIQEYEYAQKNNKYTGSFFDFVNPEKDPALVKEYEFAVKKGYKGSIADFKTLGPAASPAPAFIAVQSPTDPSKTIYVPGPTVGGLTPAAAVEKPLTAMQTQKLKAEKAADTAHVTASQSTASELKKLTDELVGSEDGRIKPHPGLGGITGYAAYLPSLPKGDARQAQQKLDTFKGKILALGREMASQNGKLGNMAVQEWKFVSDAVQALDPKAGNLDQQMRDVVRQAQAFAKNQKSKFESTYEDTGTAGGGVDLNNPLLKGQ